MLLQVSAKIGHSFDKTKTQVKNDGSSSGGSGSGSGSSRDHLTPCRSAPTPTSLQSA